MQLVSGGSIADRLPLPVADALAIARRAVRRARLRARPRHHPPRHQAGERAHRRRRPRAPVRLRHRAPASNPTPPPEDGPLTRPSLVLGTPGYMAPEARAGARPDPRMDVYAVGALLGAHVDRPPSRRRDGGPPISGGAATPHVPAAIAAVIARATAVDPARRTPDAKTLGDDLAALAAQFKATPRAALDLPPEERVWRGAVALLAAVATAVALYAALVSLTPRTMAADDAFPFTAFGNEPLADGRVLTRARFEVWPTLGAAVAIAVRPRRLRPAAPPLARGRAGAARARSSARRQPARVAIRHRAVRAVPAGRAALSAPGRDRRGHLHPGHRRLPRADRCSTASGTPRSRRVRPVDR